MQSQGFTWKSILLLLVPSLILLLLILGEYFRNSIPWYRPWQPVVLVVFGLLGSSAIEKRIRLKRAGFKPSRPGFSGEIDTLRRKLEERLAEVERAVRFQRSVDPMPAELGEFAREVIQTALVIDKKEILTDMRSLRERDQSFCTQLRLSREDEELDSQFQGYQDAMNAAIAELRLYSEDVKKRGGLYKLSQKEFNISATLITGFTLGGAFLLWRFWDQRTWPFWVGAIALVLAAIILTLLIGVLKDQE